MNEHEDEAKSGDYYHIPKEQDEMVLFWILNDFYSSQSPTSNVLP